ncbi:MAG: carbon-nitrogen hydrolase family protein [Treponema sp.]|jgi:predicted amidohydrolase|nr:carbon-nitrogen hydrolase family protein [Treponema sp.]
MKLFSILALSMYNQEEAAVLRAIEENLQGNEDIVLLPECFIDTRAYNPDDPFLEAVKNLARQGNTHILCPLIINIADAKTVNTAMLFDRQGRTLFRYEKIFPYWNEFPICGGSFNTVPGSRTAVCDTDFGRAGALICFDANFPEIWRDLADKDADIVFFPSAYSAGRQLAAHALNHHYTIVSCTRFPDCAVFDIAGREIQYVRGDTGKTLIARAAVDIDKLICHHNFNKNKVQKMLAENPGIRLEQNNEREEWFLLSSGSAEIHVRETCKKYGIEPLRDYQNRSRAYIKARRGAPALLHSGAIV